MLIRLLLCLVLAILSLPAEVSGLSGRKLDQNFLEVLDIYAENQPDLAAQKFLDTLPPSTLRDSTIFHRWRKLIRRLAADEPSNLLPILGLYSKLHARQLATGNTRAAVRVLKEIEALTGEYLLLSEDADTQGRASRLLTHVALNVRDHESLFLSLPLLRRAIEIDDQNLVAHLVLVHLLEKKGDYAATVEALDALLKIVPNQPEARLRRAIVQGKRGKFKAAIGLLEEVTLEEDVRWIRLLAFQEGARLLARQGDLDDAIRWIENGLGIFSGDESLRLQRAFLTYATLPATREQIETLAAQPWPVRSSARLRYNNWPARETLRMRSQLAREITEDLPTLARTLEDFR